MKLFLVKLGVVLEWYLYSRYFCLVLMEIRAKCRVAGQESRTGKTIMNWNQKLKSIKAGKQGNRCSLRKGWNKDKGCSSQDRINPLRYEQFSELMTEMSCYLNRFLTEFRIKTRSKLTESIRKSFSLPPSTLCLVFTVKVSQSSFGESEPFWKSSVCIPRSKT